MQTKIYAQKCYHSLSYKNGDTLQVNIQTVRKMADFLFADLILEYDVAAKNDVYRIPNDVGMLMILSKKRYYNAHI